MIEQIENSIELNKTKILSEKSIIKDFTTHVLAKMFSKGSIDASIHLNSNQYSIKVHYCHNLDLSIHSTSSLDFTFSLDNKEVDMVSHISFFTNNNRRKVNALPEFTKVLTEINELIENIDKKILKEHLLLIKSTFNNIEKLTKNQKKLEIELKEANAHSDIVRINSILVPLGSFCVESLLCEYFNIPFTNKPSRNDLKLLKETILIKEREFYSKRTNHPFFNIEFLIFEMKGENYDFGKKSLKIFVNNRNNKIEYNFNNKKSIKAINESLSNQIKFENVLIKNKSDLRNKFFNVNNYGYIKELSSDMRVYSAKSTIKEF
jgi:hypothetical protein